ncbi:MAG: DUF1810 domain-containing protein [Clostridia bacterium]|nr:DUF1810 domain-containing protein [Clostridia bacterium]MBR1686540.1 DUF1810 domain-containing protein [Clostridia bacterium]MBR2288559.1 DUF1810 domain-containing protein [Clostridia bacterium]
MHDDLSRFVRAQEWDYAQARKEIQAGRKESHWMWYIFPQLRGLGHSDMAQYYGIESMEEAKAYLAHPILGERLREISADLLALPEDLQDVGAIFGFPDDLKLYSSMTLFARAAEEGSVFYKVLDVYFGGQEDEQTLQMLGFK